MAAAGGSRAGTLDDLDLEACVGERLGGAVVELLGDARALRFLGLQDVAAHLVV